jgi:predicted SprT family Zn-dependent metalloprotease
MDYRNMISKSISDRKEKSGAYKEFDATQLYCPKCKEAMPVTKRLLLILPEGDKYEYRCAHCAESLGTKIDRHQKPVAVIV